jgi:hypothetical protein
MENRQSGIRSLVSRASPISLWQEGSPRRVPGLNQQAKSRSQLPERVVLVSDLGAGRKVKFQGHCSRLQTRYYESLCLDV